MQTNKYILNDQAYLMSYIYDDYRVDTKPVARPAIIICPGGGWMTLSEREGEPVALEFAQRGYAAFVLHYSVSEKQVAPGDFGLVEKTLTETEKAYEIIKDLAKQGGIDNKKVSVMGFSAGGMLASLFASHHPELLSCILCYPVLDIRDEFEFINSPLCPRENRELIKKGFSCIGVSDRSEDMWDQIDPIARINPLMPKTFIWHGAMDDLVRPAGSINYAQRLVKTGVGIELHIYDNCGHGISLGTRETAAVEKEINAYGAVWFDQLIRWMEELKNEEK